MAGMSAGGELLGRMLNPVRPDHRQALQPDSDPGSLAEPPEQRAEEKMCQELLPESSARFFCTASRLPIIARHSSPIPIHTSSRNRRSNAKVMPVTSE